MEDAFRFSDDLGPTKIVHIYEPRLGLKATLLHLSFTAKMQ
jgi:hypothetical protein